MTLHITLNNERKQFYKIEGSMCYVSRDRALQRNHACVSVSRQRQLLMITRLAINEYTQRY